MPKYARFDSSLPSPSPVTGWFDADSVQYPTLPKTEDLLELTDVDWKRHMGAWAWWAVDNGKLVQIDDPALATATLAQRANMALHKGLAVTLNGSIDLTATFPCDAAAQTKMNTVVGGIASTGQFPGGASSYPMKDSAGTWHTFTVDQYKAVAGAISTYVAALDLIIDGNPFGAATLPSASATLTV